MDREYCYLCSVDTGTKIVVARIDCREAAAGNLVILDNGELGHVLKVLFIEASGEGYEFFADLITIFEIVDVYQHSWSKEENDAT